MMNDDQMMKDTVTIEAARAGDRRALDRLLAAVRPQVTGVVRRYIRSDADADDVIQETMVRIYRRIDTFRHDGSFAGWASRIGRNCALMHLRREKRRPEFGVDELAPRDVDDRTPYDDVSGRQLVEQAWQAVQDLEPKYRRAIELRVARGLSMEEIGSALGLTAGGAKSRLFRAREHVRVRVAA